MKLLVTGSNGQLGSELRRILSDGSLGEVTFIDKEDLDLTDRGAVERYIAEGEFTHIVNCAAYTAVEKAEEEKKQCTDVNVDAVMNLARAAGDIDCKLLHISTDYVFDGSACRPYTEVDTPRPLSVYGTTKRRGETALLGLMPECTIIRTGWLYSEFGNNFVKTILKLGASGKHLEVVFDQIGTPTYAADLAAVIKSMLSSGHWTPGLFHYSNEGVASWYDLAVTALEIAGMPEAAAAVVPVLSADRPSAATRPLYGVLDKSKIKATFGIKIPHWQDALRRCIKSMNHG